MNEFFMRERKRGKLLKLPGSIDEKLDKSVFSKRDLGLPCSPIVVDDFGEPFAIQKAIDKLPNNPGGVVWISEGEWQQPAELTVNKEGVSLYGAGKASTKILWSGPPGTYENPYFIVKVGESANPRDFVIRDLELNSNSTWTYPFRAYCRNGLFRNLIVNHTMFLWKSEIKTVIKNIHQKGQNGGPGNDFGVNIVGSNVTVENFVASLETEYQAGFVINHPWENIKLHNIYAKGKFGSFVHWYIPRSNTQLIGGRTSIEDFHCEYTAVPKWGHFATFPCIDTEGSSGTYSGDFGKITIRNGRIHGPGLPMVGSENGIGVCSLFDLEVGGAGPFVDLTVEDVKITGMRRFSDYDIMCPNMSGGRIKLHNLRYTGDWAVWLLDGLKDTQAEIRNCWIAVGARDIKVVSSNSGTSYIIVDGNFLSNPLTLTQNSGHTMYYQPGQNTKKVIGSGATLLGVGDFVPEENTAQYLGNYLRQWKALYLGSGTGSGVIWENEFWLRRLAANALSLVNANFEIYGDGRELVFNSPSYGNASMKLTDRFYLSTPNPVRLTNNNKIEFGANTELYSPAADILQTKIFKSHDHYPTTDAYFKLGSSSFRWLDVYCVTLHQGDSIFDNGIRITEAEKLGYGKGLVFLNPKGKVMAVLDDEGNLKIAGKVVRLRKVKRRVAS